LILTTIRLENMILTKANYKTMGIKVMNRIITLIPFIKKYRTSNSIDSINKRLELLKA
jgi:hypothetical protein